MIDDGVAEVHALAAAIRQPALVERLQEQVQQAGTRLLHFIQQHHRVRIVFELICEHPAALAADDAARHADQLVRADTPVLVLGHVDADHLLLVAEQERGDRFCQLCLADAGRPEEQQHAVGSIEAVFQRSLVEHQPPRHGADGVRLTDDALLQLGLDVVEAIRHVAVDHVLRESAPRPR